MIDVLLLRLDAPLMSFGTTAIDNRNPTQRFPARSMLAGMLANALGWDHAEPERTGAVQARLRYAARCDVPGHALRDFQTVDLDPETSPFMARGWTTRGAPEERGGGSAGEGTHIRYRDYLADAVYTVALTLDPASDPPDLDRVAAAIAEPARPLFIGRKPCLPAGPLVVGRTTAGTVLDALRAAPRVVRGPLGPLDAPQLDAWWPEEDPCDDDTRDASHVIVVCDERDWVNQIHVGRRFVREGRINPPTASAP